MARVISRAHPLSSGLGVHEEPLRIEGSVPFEHEIDGSPNLVGEDAQGLTVPMFPFEPVVELLAFREMSEDGDGRLTECPLEMYVADLGAGRTGPLACRRRFAFDEASIGSESLDGLEATDVVDLVEDRERQNLADPRNRAKPVVGLRRTRWRRLRSRSRVALTSGGYT